MLGALGLGGCVDVVAERADQAGDLARVVHLEATVQAPDAAATAQVGQLLAAWLVPADATAADTAAAFTADVPPAAPVTLLARDPSLDATLEATRPAPAGRRWVGYRSGMFAAIDSAPPTTWTLRADVTAGGGEHFAHAAMAGVRSAGLSGLDPGRATDCTAADTVCGPTSAGGVLELQDVLGAGASVRAAAGATVTVPFGVRRVGGAGPALALSATTDLPGAIATPGTAALPAGDAGFADLTVTVAVPAGAAAGTYGVQLVARAGDEVRRFSGELAVRDDGAAPAAVTVVVTGAGGGGRAPRSVALDAARVARVGRAGAVDLGALWCLRAATDCGPLRVTVSARAADLSARSAARAVVARRTLTVPPSGWRRLRLTVGPHACRALRSGRPLRVVVSVRTAAGRLVQAESLTLRGA